MRVQHTGRISREPVADTGAERNHRQPPIHRQADRTMAAGIILLPTAAATPAKLTLTTNTGTIGIGSPPIAMEFTSNENFGISTYSICIEASCIRLRIPRGPC